MRVVFIFLGSVKVETGDSFNDITDKITVRSKQHTSIGIQMSNVNCKIHWSIYSLIVERWPPGWVLTKEI